jgi:hypothetical protein
MNFYCEHDLMEAVVDSEELSIFDSESAVISMVDYKWEAYAFGSHKLGCFFHILYIISLILYINNTFLIDKKSKDDDNDAKDEDKKLLLQLDGDKPAEEIEMPKASIEFMGVLAFCLLYPVFYDGTQMVKQRMDYF